ncbi:MAG: DUF2812 domain-containing protein [Bacillota bacterium]
MRHTVYKLFLATEYEKEEKWLNDMSAKGLALIYAGICRYIFEDQDPGKYTYKIELLDNLPWNNKSTSYLQFLEETGVEHVGSVFRWVYLRKRIEDGPFSLYSDVGSMIRYLRRLQIFFICLTIFEFSIGIMNISIGITSGNVMNLVNISMGILLLFLGGLLAIAAFKHTHKLQALRRENRIRE